MSAAAVSLPLDQTGRHTDPPQPARAVPCWDCGQEIAPGGGVQVARRLLAFRVAEAGPKDRHGRATLAPLASVQPALEVDLHVCVHPACADHRCVVAL